MAPWWARQSAPRKAVLMVPGAPGPGGGKEGMKTSDLENHPDLSRQKKTLAGLRAVDPNWFLSSFLKVLNLLEKMAFWRGRGGEISEVRW